MTESETAFESETDAATPADTAALLAVESDDPVVAADSAAEISVLCDVLLDDSVVATLVAMLLAELSGDPAAAAELAIDSAVDAVAAAVDAESTKLFHMPAVIVSAIW